MAIRHAAAAAALVMLAGFAGADAQDATPHAGMLRYPDVSATQIVFLYADDLWLAPREGGTAVPLASPPGEEAFPGSARTAGRIAFVGNYDGNRRHLHVPVDGGRAARG